MGDGILTSFNNFFDAVMCVGEMQGEAKKKELVIDVNSNYIS
jgi:hypothetical protein